MFSRNISVAVLGAGHGGLALAAYLGQQGHLVALWNRSEERILPVAEARGIRLTSPGSKALHAPIALATCNMATALSSARIVLVAVPASAHADVARECAAHLREGQVVLLVPGRTGGALEFRRVLRAAGCRAHIILGEANTFPFASRCIAPAEAVIHGVKAEVQAAALPAKHTPELLAACRPFLPMLRPARSVLHTGLANLGAILHPVIALQNAARIQSGVAFDFYCDGVTPSVADTLAAADAERLRIAHAYGVPACSLRDWIARAYGHHADSLQAAIAGNPSYAGIRAPATIVHRYLLEDVPTGLIPLLELGAAAGLLSPTLASLVKVARDVLGNERWRRQRTLDALGLAGCDVAAIRAFVERGSTSTTPRETVTVSLASQRWRSEFELIPQV